MKLLILTCDTFGEGMICNFQVGIYQILALSNMKNERVGNYYKNEELIWVFSPQFNKSLRCIGDLISCVLWESLLSYPCKNYMKGFAVLSI